jgi:hypothetical protein
MNEGHKIQFPMMPGQYELIRDVPDHEVLLVFVSDDDAEQFRDWLTDEGWLAFAYAVDAKASK